MKIQCLIVACAVVSGIGLARSISWAADGDPGRASFVRYCASCQGVGGKGDENVSRSLKIKPADLTQLQKKNNGVFPTEKVMATIDGRTRIDAHGESRMSVWGELFEKEAVRQKDPSGTVGSKIKLIAGYVATLQR